MLQFTEFADALITNCLKINEQNPEWTIENKKATGKLSNQIIKVTASDVDSRGSLPNKISEKIKYYTFSSSTSVPVARFIISFTCLKGTFVGDNCRCQGNDFFLNYYNN